RLLSARDEAERAEAAVKGAPAHVPEDAWETITEAIARGVQLAFGAWILVPILALGVVAVVLVRKAASCDAPRATTATWTGSVLDSARADVRAAGACRIDMHGDVVSKICAASVTCDGRALFSGRLACVDDERVVGTDSDGDDETARELVLSG